MPEIWEKLRAAPPTLSPPDLAAAGGDEGGVGEGEEDRLSALPDDVLLLVLLHLPSAADAARTCALSSRWRRVWAQLPELRFPLPAEPGPLALPSPAVAARAALASHAAPALRLLSVVANDADPRDVAAVLRLAAARLTGELSFRNVVPEDRKDGEAAEADVEVELPCFDRAEKVILCLCYLRLVLPPSAVFTKLTAVPRRLRHRRRLLMAPLPFAATPGSLGHSGGVQTHYPLRLSPKFAFAYCGGVTAAHCRGARADRSGNH